MKKGLIISLALTLMILFVGCGLSSQLAGTKWTRTTSQEVYDDMFLTSTKTYEFNKDDSFKYTSTRDYPSELEEFGYEDEKYEIKGSWYCNDNRLYLEVENYPEGEFYDVVILEDELILKNGSDLEKYNKVD